MRVTFDLGSVPLRMWIGPLLRALTDINRAWLRAHPSAPSIYRAHVRYVREPLGEEIWRVLPVVLQEGAGDCEDLATARAAELAQHGRAAEAIPVFPPAPPGIELVHVVVRHSNGDIEDPSRALGMEGSA